ncbi:hypothetical protein PR048_007285 [Dryococelus australis]|uniref:Uncharacterized protein n=1 Tax=Dryococelus australis TaxID=614101 RepID=A0ABQ9IE57_9NEOP|nr:hypothetical protein PR048_007285 [Dryococelus australis]
MQQRRSERAWETGDPREDPPTNGIVRHDSHMRRSGVARPGIEPGSTWWEASRLTAQPPIGRAREMADPRENPLTSGIIRHDTHVRKSLGRPRR